MKTQDMRSALYYSAIFCFFSAATSMLYSASGAAQRGADNELLFMTTLSSGSCPPDTKCGFQLKLFQSGELVIDAIKKRSLDQSTLSSIRDFIVKSGIMSKDCQAQTGVVDISSSTYISVGTTIKKIGTLGCDAEVKNIVNFISSLGADT